MAIVARSHKGQLDTAETAAVRKFFENPALDSRYQEHNANQLEDYMYRWGVVIDAESLATAFQKLSEAGVLKLRSVAQQKYDAAAQGYTTEQQNTLANWLKSRHLVNTPGADETLENSAAILNAMRGRSFDYHNLDFCRTYLQSKGQKLYWEQRPAQGRENRGHRATSPEDYKPSLGNSSSVGPGLVSHSNNPKFNGQAEREAREAERRRFNPDAQIEADIAFVNKYWNEQIAKAVAEGRTHSERARIAQVAQQTPGGPRLQAAAAQEEAARIRKAREMGR